MDKNNSKRNYRLDQIGYVVKDINKTSKKLHDLLGLGPFKIMNWPVEGINPSSMLDNKPSRWRMILGFADLGDIKIELIQPIEGDNIFSRFINESGPGLHHLRFSVEDFDNAVEDFIQMGYECMASGKGVHKGSRWAFFDTRNDLDGLIVELRTDLGGKAGEDNWLDNNVEDKIKS